MLTKKICRQCFKRYGWRFDHQEWREGMVCCPPKAPASGQFWCDITEPPPKHCVYRLEQLMAGES